MAELTKRIAEASPQQQPTNGQGNQELIGDLKTGTTSPIGELIAGILQGRIDPHTDEAGYTPPGVLGSRACSADVCCVWSYISRELTTLFTGPTTRCNGLARAAIRLGFHDAGTWSKALAEGGRDFGGADGSIILAEGEMQRLDNRGLEAIAIETRLLGEKYGVGYGDLIQFMATHAVVTCPLGPRFRAFVGREDSDQEAPTDLLPDVNAPAEDLITLFEDKTINAAELIALVGAHTTSRQFFVDPKRFGAPQDETPGVWDVKFYNTTLDPRPHPGVFKFASDEKLSVHPPVAATWEGFADPVNGQRAWNRLYARAYIRLSLLGVNNINSKSLSLAHSSPCMLDSRKKTPPPTRNTYGG